jgi:hypothetical protein
MRQGCVLPAILILTLASSAGGHAAFLAAPLAAAVPKFSLIILWLHFAA